MGMFDDVPMAAPAPAGRGGGMFDDIPMAGARQPEDNKSSFWGRARDIGRSIEEGGNRAVSGTLGAPADILSLAIRGADTLDAWAQGQPYEQVKARRDARAPMLTPEALQPFGGQALRESMAAPGSAFARPEYQPQTTAGRYAKTAAEFGAQGAVMPGSLARNVIGYGIVPGLASEAAGQATEGSQYEPWARAGAGLAAGGLAGLVPSRSTAAQAVGHASGDLVPAERAAALERFDGIMADAQTNGIPLSPAFAWDAATNGASDVAGLFRHAEAMGRMRGFNAQMPDAVDRAGRAQFARFADLDTMPSMLGERASQTARAALDASPAGRNVEAALREVGPRVTADQAGQAVQADLRAVQDAREAVRTQQAARDYEVARAAPERVGIDRTVTVERPGEPVLTPQRYSRPQFEADAPQPLGPAPLASEGAEAGARPQSLLDYLARNGGIPLDAETRAADLNRVYRPGAGTLARRDAPTWDQIRVRLAEQGFLPPGADGYANAAGVRDYVLDALHQERIGRGRTVRMGEDAQAGTARRGDVADEYDAALSMARGRLDEQLTRAGVDPASVHPDIRSRTLNAMIGDERLDPLDAFERVVGATRPNPPPLSRATTVTEEIPAPRFGQVNPQPALDTIDDLLRTAKGDVRGALEGARRDFLEYRPDPVSGVRETDLSIEGLLHVRERLDQQIAAARDVGDRTKMRDLERVRSALDGQLKGAPEVAAADANFAANSRPLQPFGGNEPLGRVTARDDLTGRMRMPSEQVLGNLSGASATREALREGGAATQGALQQRLVTQIMDGAQDFRGGVSAERLRAAMREHEDVLNQFPEARERLNRIALAQDGRDALRGTLLGRMAERDRTTAQAINILFPQGGELLANGEREVGAAVAALVRQNPTVARQLVRAKAENAFGAATKDVQSGPNQMGGAKYRAQLVGHPQEAANINAAVRALPDGDVIADGFSRFLDVLKATGLRRNVGSNTSYNDEFLAAMKEGGMAEQAVKLGSGFFTQYPKKVRESFERWRLGKSVDELARLFSDPDAVGAFRGLVAAGNRGGDIRGPVARLVAIAARGAQGPQPLQLTVRPGEARQ